MLFYEALGFEVVDGLYGISEIKCLTFFLSFFTEISWSVDCLMTALIVPFQLNLPGVQEHALNYQSIQGSKVTRHPATTNLITLNN
jgi:hypothetical protein